jgi:hypothetical protein
MISHHQNFGSVPSGRPVPLRDFTPGEVVSGATLIDHAQGFGGRYHGQYGVPIADLKRGEYERASRMISHPQAFGGLGAGFAVPLRDFVPGEVVSGATLVDHAQGFGSIPSGRPVPRADFAPGEIVSGARMISHRQQFGGLGDWVPFTVGEPEPKGGSQGGWLSPNQVPPWDRESGAEMISHPQNFGGLGDGNAVPVGDFVEGEIESASRMIRHRQAFGGMGSHASAMASLPQAMGAMGRHPDDGPYIPYTPGEPEPKDGGQGTWLSPDQVPAWDRESAAQLIAGPESFGGMGATGDNVGLPTNLNLTPICDPQTGACISYATPREIQTAIGRKVGGQSALIQSQAKLPAFYEHPNLGPWGVDPAQAYQYWWAQQAAMQRAGAEAPIPIWGSPGAIPNTLPLPPSPIAQEASFNPYTNAYPVAGTSVERF